MKSTKKAGAIALTLALSLGTFGTSVVNAADYTVNSTVKVYSNAYDAKNGTNPITTYSAGEYNIYKTYDGMLNISKTSGPGGWINPNTVTSTTTTTQYFKARSSVLVRSAKSSDPSTKLGVVSSGQVIQGTIDGAWIKFQFNGRTAYTALRWYDKTSAPSTSPRSYVANTSVLVRSAKSSDSSTKLGVISKGSVISAVQDGAWLKFQYYGKTAYSAMRWYSESDQEATVPTTAQTVQKTTVQEKTPVIAQTSVNSIAGRAAQIARSKVGSSYVWGATGPWAFDCSGLTQFAYAQAGLQIGRSTYNQVAMGYNVSYNNMLPGDLIFFGDPYSPYHVAMYVGNGQIVHASTPSTGVIIDSVNNSWILYNYSVVKRVAN